MESVSILVLLLLTCPLLAVDPTPLCEDAVSVVTIGIVLNDGSLLTENGKIYPAEDYWKISPSDDSFEYRVCVCNKTRCRRKCCPEGHAYLQGKPVGICSPYANVTVFSDENPDVHVLLGFDCEEKFMLYPGEEFTVDEEGILFLNDSGPYTFNQYCWELFVAEDWEQVLPFLCIPPQEEKSESAMFLLIPVSMLISEPFLIATFLVHAIIPELRNLPGLCMMSYVSGIISANLFLATVQLMGRQDAGAFCVGPAFIIYFSFLASFFWMNIMCFDMWWTFSGFRRSRSTGKKLERKKFLIYSLYAWGCPLVLLIICIVMQFGDFPESYITPQFGVASCWFADQKAIFVYFYAPVALIVVANIIMFITTALKILKLKRETAMLKNSDSKRHDDEGNKERFSLYLKLFVVMGVNWGMELISWVAGGPEYLWYISDLGNTLQGVLIFFIFVWKDKIKRLLVRRFRGTDATSSSYKSSTRLSHIRNSTTRTTSINSTYLVETTNMNPLVLTEKREA